MAVAGSDDGYAGLAVVRRDGVHAVLRELVAAPGSAAFDALLRGVVMRLRRQGVRTLSAPVLDSSPLVPALRRWGFRSRESAPFVVVTGPDDPLRGVVTRGCHWLLTDGDRDA